MTCKGIETDTLTNRGGKKDTLKIVIQAQSQTLVFCLTFPLQMSALSNPIIFTSNYFITGQSLSI